MVCVWKEAVVSPSLRRLSPVLPSLPVELLDKLYLPLWFVSEGRRAATPEIITDLTDC